MHTPAEIIGILRNFVRIQEHNGACVGLVEIALNDLERELETAQWHADNERFNANEERATRDRICSERDRFKLIAQEMLQKFTHEATTGEPVVRSEWVPIDTRARWREALK